VPESTYGVGWIALRPWAWLVDRVPKLRALRRGCDGAKILGGLGAAFPDMTQKRRERLMRAMLRQRAYNTGITVLISRMPRLALFLARAIPTRDLELVRELIQGNRPIVLVVFHTGPVYLQLAVIVANLAGRRSFVMHHTEGAMLLNIERFLGSIGCVSVPKSSMVARTLVKALRENHRPVAIIAGDYDHGTLPINFLGLRMRAAEGATLIKKKTGAAVISAIWERHGFLPCVRFAGPYELSENGDPAASITQRVFAKLEPVVVRTPHRWVAWDNFLERLESETR
jgi:lauroyl/myristoyl acyltransferase